MKTSSILFRIVLFFLMLCTLQACSSVQYSNDYSRSSTQSGFRQYESQPAPSFQSQRQINTSTEEYGWMAEHHFRTVADHPFSTFALDTDTASYANARRFLQQGQLPPTASVRVEEFVNTFSYQHPEPEQGAIGMRAELGPCPWNPAHQLLLIGLRGKTVYMEERPPIHLVFAIDKSGSMSDKNKLPLLKKSLSILAETLTTRDRLSIVTYNSRSQVVLEASPGNAQSTNKKVIQRLKSGGSTAGSEGIQRAYAIAEKHFIPGGINRVILASDGDFNVGITQHQDLMHMIHRCRQSGIYLSVLGFGDGNLKDHTLEQLADQGNGNYSYIDSLAEAEKVLAREVSESMMTVARDVKTQIEFNPSRILAYRQVGYENRALRDNEFYIDHVDAGELGAGQTVTVLYEIIPAHANTQSPRKYQTPTSEAAEIDSELLHVQVRYKDPTHQGKNQVSLAVTDDDIRDWNFVSYDFCLASAAAAFALLLKQSPHLGHFHIEQLHALIERAKRNTHSESSTQNNLDELQQLIHRTQNLLAENYDYRCLNPANNTWPNRR